MIRELRRTDTGYEAWLGVRNAVWPDEPLTLAQIKYDDAVWPAAFFARRFVVEAEGSIAGVAHVFENHWQYQPGKYDIEILVHPAYRNRGIGSAVYDFITRDLAGRSPALTSLVGGTREDAPHSVAFLQRRGFEVIMRWARSRLDLASFDRERFSTTIPRLAQQGIRIASVGELAARDGAWQHKYYELNMTAGQDAPSPDPLSQTPFEKFVETTIDPPQFVPDGTFIAVDRDGRWLAATELADNGNHKHLTTPFTCVRAEYRRRGIASALKVRAIEFARDYGAETITAANEAANPMYQINLALGFEPLPQALTLKKQLA